MTRSSTMPNSSSAPAPLTSEQLLEYLDAGALWPPQSDTAESADLQQAYRRAQDVERLREQRGERPRGYKIGFTNVDMWARYGVTAPIWGRIWDTTLSDAPEGTSILALQGLCQPRIEPEVVFGLRTAPHSADPQDLYDAIEWVAPGFEIVQSHQPEWRFTAGQAIVDGGLHGRLVVGPRKAVADLAGDATVLQDVLTALQVTLVCDEHVVEVGSGAKVLGNPLLALSHLVQGLSKDTQAAGLAAGDVVTTGTLTDAWSVEAGQVWLAQYHGLWSDLSVSFESTPA